MLFKDAKNIQKEAVEVEVFESYFPGSVHIIEVAGISRETIAFP